MQKDTNPVNFIARTIKSACNRVDLLFALEMAKNNPGREAALAAVLGFVPVSCSELDDEVNGQPETPVVDTSLNEIVEHTQPKSRSKFLFRPYHLLAVDIETSIEEWQTQKSVHHESGVLGKGDMTAWNADYPQPKAIPIVPWTRLWPRLRLAVARTRLSTLDVGRLTQQLAYGKAVSRFPRKRRLSWPNLLPVVFDFSDRLTPYWEDWHWLKQQLQSRFKRQIRFFRLHGVPQKPLQPFMGNQPDARYVNWPELVTGRTLLIVSDLGMLDPAHPWPSECWQEKLASYRRRGVRVIVLAPVSFGQMQPALVNSAGVVRLSPDSSLRLVPRMQPTATANVLEQELAVLKPNLSPAAETLMTMLSVATRVEPALLRELRSGLLNGNRDAGLEGELWCYPELNTAATACAISSWAVDYWRNKFNQLPQTLQLHTRKCLRGWHARLPQVIHHEETLLWQSLTTIGIDLEEKRHAQRARDFFNRMVNTLQEKKPAEEQQLGPNERMVQLADRHVHWTASVLGNKESYIYRLSVAVNQAEPGRGGIGLPEDIDPVAWLKLLPNIGMQRMKLIQREDSLWIVTEMSQTPWAEFTPLATFELDREAMLWGWRQGIELPVYHPWNFLNENIQNAPVLPRLVQANPGPQPSASLYLHTGRQRLCFVAFNPPGWAETWGQDIFGLYVELKIGQVIQRFRWIAPGTFLMGSPESEPERLSDEKQHEVTLTQGYWLADTVCTQALWAAVMGEKNNPSHFKGDLNLPVETVSWADAQQFIDRLNHDYPDLFACLSTEAQWEYACRAGTITPFSFGEQITPEQVNYHGHYPYAGGKKGQYRQETVAVKSLPPNPWGLYEMHGNVLEWCADWYGAYPEHAVIDPAGPENGAGRVLRGGSWRDDGGWDVRSAARYGYESDTRRDHIGFRLALGRTGVSRQAQENSAEERAAAAEQEKSDG